MPPSFSISSGVGNTSGGTAHAEEAEVSYTITALWGANDGSDQALCVLLSFPQMGAVTNVVFQR